MKVSQCSTLSDLYRDARRVVKTPFRAKQRLLRVFRCRFTVHYANRTNGDAGMRASKVFKQQSSHGGAGLGTYCGTSPLRIGDHSRRRRLAAINLTPLTLRVPIRTLRPVVIVVSQNPRVYCYLYNGNYQFAGIHYGIRDGFGDLQAVASRAETRASANYAQLAWCIFALPDGELHFRDARTAHKKGN